MDDQAQIRYAGIDTIAIRHKKESQLESTGTDLENAKSCLKRSRGQSVINY
jgi:hypothetical protein